MISCVKYLNCTADLRLCFRIIMQIVGFQVRWLNFNSNFVYDDCFKIVTPLNAQVHCHKLCPLNYSNRFQNFKNGETSWNTSPVTSFPGGGGGGGGGGN